LPVFLADNHAAILGQSLLFLLSAGFFLWFLGSLRSHLLAREAGTGRVTMIGPRTGDGLAAAYAAADLLVLPSRGETYGMVLTEAFARGIPVLVSDVGGVREALGPGPPPGLLVPPDDPVALAGALRAWLGDADLRERLCAAARDRRESLATWADTADRVATALSGVAA